MITTGDSDHFAAATAQTPLLVSLARRPNGMTEGSFRETECVRASSSVVVPEDPLRQRREDGVDGRERKLKPATRKKKNGNAQKNVGLLCRSTASLPIKEERRTTYAAVYASLGRN